MADAFQSFGANLADLTAAGQFDTAVYDDAAGNQYVCTADTGTPLTAAKWQVCKVATATAPGLTRRVLYAGGTNLPKWPATDLATVEALSY